MDLPSKQVYDALINAGVAYLYHANSIITACQFLRSGCLLSRGTAERQGYLQSIQKSDDLDKRNSVWFDIFADAVDIHDRARCANSYGPVLFVLDIDIITHARSGRIWVTKLNPTKWANKSRKERWFQSKADLINDFVPGEFDQMVVFRHCGGQLPYGRFLKEIILDDPKCTVHDRVDIYDMAYGALTLAMTEGGIDLPISKRRCRYNCRCEKDYANDLYRTYEMFVPQI